MLLKIRFNSSFLLFSKMRSNHSQNCILALWFLIQASQVHSSPCTFSGSRIKCLNAEITTVISSINQLSQELNLDSITVLTLDGIRFQNNQISSGWLSNVAVKFSVLNIHNTNLFTIEDRAFSGSPFGSLQELHVWNTKLETITYGTFQDTNLRILGIGFGDFWSNLEIEENALGAISDSLIVLSFSGCLTSEKLLKITGPKTKLVSLVSLTLYNNRLEELKEETFIGVPNMSVLYTERSKIREIEQGTFDPVVLERLNLGDNELTTLPEGLFRNVKGGISIYGNKWKCDCNLVWLRDLFHNYAFLFSHRQFYCSTPAGDVPYQDVEFCPTNVRI